MPPHPVIHLVHSVPSARDGTFAGLMRRLGARRLARAMPGPAPETAADPYLLLMLADQELVDGREEQARYLVEAAYELYDQKATPGTCRLHVAN
jgi:hypothetical protein